MSTRSARTKKVQVQTEEETMLSAWFGQGFAEAAARLAKAEDLLHKCNAQSAEALELATSALKKRTDGNSTKLNTHMNEMTEKMDLLKARVQEVDDLWFLACHALWRCSCDGCIGWGPIIST